MLKPLDVLSIITTVRSQILCHLTAKITCGLNLADSEVITVATILKVWNGIK